MKSENFQVRYNVMSVSSIMSFANVKGGMNQTCKDVYFIRCVGSDEKYLDDMKQMDQVLSVRQWNNRGRYTRLIKLPQLNQPEDISFYSQVYRQWLDSDKNQLELKNIKQDTPVWETVKEAVKKICKTFEGVTPNASETITKNFIIKILYWSDAAISEFLKEWNSRESYKLAVCGLLKKQEYLFCYYATMLGIDVIVLSPEKELELESELLNLSAKLSLPLNKKIDFPRYDKEEFRNEQVKESLCQISVNPLAKDQTASSQLQEEQKKRVILPPRPEKRGLQPKVESIAKERREKEFEELALLASSVVMITIHGRSGEVIGTGSGIMIGTKGYILTNNHVACGGEYYSIRIEDDDKVYETSEVIKYHSILDLALIRINRILKPIPVYKGESELVRGQKVVAIGSPLGFFNSVSNGIISGFRKFDDVNMIQFTAPISHGSSGGAVLNMYGEVIGISTAGVDNGQNINLAVDYHDINNFVRGFA